ncbi:hypothetical protein U9M48_007724 [Paspalum notatum var. saurae]|uniref:Transmembrane protein 230 n=1 Tax=Paspalum notatum var. saurae TaxID=547442 RepID=A0AAQ3WCC0_PASNO
MRPQPTRFRNISPPTLGDFRPCGEAHLRPRRPRTRGYISSADRSMASRRNVRYSPLSTEDGEDNNFTKEDVDLRFAYTPKSYRKIPWKSIALALFLLLLGTSLLFLSYFIFTGHMEGDSSQAYGLLFLGFLSFLPGFYETRVAYYSWRGAPGYTFASIPDY